MTALVSRYFQRSRLLLAAITGIFGLVAGLFSKSPDPRAYFIESPVAVAISPSGEWLAFCLHEDGKWILYTRSIISGQGIKRDLGGVIDQLIFVNDKQLVYRQAKGAGQSLSLLEVTGTLSLEFTPPGPGAQVSLIENQPSPDVSGLMYFSLRYLPDHLDGLFSLPIPRGANVTEYKFSQVADNLGIDEWIFDRQGKMLGGIGKRGLDKVLFHLGGDATSGEKSLNTVFKSSADDFPGFSGYGCPAGSLVAMGYFPGNNYSSAVQFDLTTRQFGQPVLPVTKANIRSTTLSPDLARIDAFSFWGGPGQPVPLTDDFRKIAQSITAIVGPGGWDVQGVTRDYSAAIVVQGSDAMPQKYWHIDLVHHKGFVFFDAGRALGTAKFEAFSNLAIRARDGLELPCYQLGLKTASKSAPLLIWVPGGPFEGIHPEWTPLFQYLTANGVVVVAVNYRGSMGFGKVFSEAGKAQAGRGMVDDVEDVIAYLAKQPDFNRRRVILLGASFGGHLAVETLGRKHSKVDGLVLVNPLIDPETLFRAAKENGFSDEEVGYQKHKWYGNDSSADRSVMGEAKQLLLPKLIAQSRHDEKVSIEVVRDFSRQSSLSGTAAEWIELDDSHDLKPESWVVLAPKLLEFIGRVEK